MLQPWWSRDSAKLEWLEFNYASTASVQAITFSQDFSNIIITPPSHWHKYLKSFADPQYSHLSHHFRI